MWSVATSRAREDRPAYHHGDLRRALLDAAATLLAEHGAEGVSLREAARRAGVSHNAPYRHFPTREALLAALAEEGFARLAALLESAAPAAKETRLAAVGRAYLAFAAASPALFLLMFGPGLRKQAHPDLAAAARRAMDALRAAMPPDSARHHTIGAWALVHGLAHLIVDGQLANDIPTESLITDALSAYRP